MVNIPIEDAVTIAYVDAVHALSEIKEALEANHQGHFDAADEGMSEAIEDLGNVLRMLKPHVAYVTDTWVRPSDDPNMRVVWGNGAPRVG